MWRGRALVAWAVLERSSLRMQGCHSLAMANWRASARDGVHCTCIDVCQGMPPGTQWHCAARLRARLRARAVREVPDVVVMSRLLEIIWSRCLLRSGDGAGGVSRGRSAIGVMDANAAALGGGPLARPARQLRGPS
jgi:hypothetical protein